MDNIHDYYAIKAYEADFGFRQQFNVSIKGVLLDRIYTQIEKVVGNQFAVLQSSPPLHAAAINEVVTQLYRQGYMRKLEDILVQEVRRLIVIYTSE